MKYSAQNNSFSVDFLNKKAFAGPENVLYTPENCSVEMVGTVVTKSLTTTPKAMTSFIDTHYTLNSFNAK